MAINYVKFIRGTPTAFAKLSQKDNDTLYFISDTNSKKGSLYLGEKLISESIANLEDLINISIDESLQDKNLLSYDAKSEKWINKSVIEAIGLMTGASATAQGGAGLVPAPGIGQDGLFLRGDGVWATPVGGGSNVEVKPDGKTISFSEDGVTIALKDFGVKYYKYVPASDGVEAHYITQIVNDANPWKENLEARVTVDNEGQFVLGWFEKDLSAFEQIATINQQVEAISVSAKENKSQIEVLSGSVNNIAALLNGKADNNNVYTKAEVDAKILDAGHLTRKTFNTLEEAISFATSVVNPEAYIYMVASNVSTDDKYMEYLYVEGELELVGSWEVNLDNYATKQELNAQITSLTDMLNGKADKIEIQSINTQVSSLADLLNKKADKTEVVELSTTVNNINSRVGSIEEFLNSEYFKPLENIQTDLNIVKDAVTWKEL